MESRNTVHFLVSVAFIFIMFCTMGAIADDFVTEKLSNTVSKSRGKVRLQLVSPEYAFPFLLGGSISGKFMGNDYLGYDDKNHYILERGTTRIFYAPSSQIDVHFLWEMRVHQRELRDRFYELVLNQDLDIPFAASQRSPDAVEEWIKHKGLKLKNLPK